MFYYVYALCDPVTREIRYVGRTSVNPETRFQQHLGSTNMARKTQCAKWISSLAKSGHEPVLIVLQSFATSSDMVEGERYWIAHGRLVGWDLVNTVHNRRYEHLPSSRLATNSNPLVGDSSKMVDAMRSHYRSGISKNKLSKLAFGRGYAGTTFCERFDVAYGTLVGEEKKQKAV